MAASNYAISMCHAGRKLSCALGLWLATSAAVVLAQADLHHWATGVELGRRLAAPVSLSWTNTPASRALHSLSAAQHVAIVLDRRIDPDQPISLAIAEVPLAVALERIASKMGAGYCQLGPIAYLGPPTTATNLRTLAALRSEEVRRLPKVRITEFLRLGSSQWEQLAEPQQLAADLAKSAQVELVGADQIPHDLWPAANLPPMTWIDRLTLLAAQFDLAFKIENEGRQVRLLRAPKDPAIARTYRVGQQAETLAGRWKRALPAARVTAANGSIRVQGRLEDHELIEARYRATPARRTTITAGKEVYRFSAENAALDQVVAQLAMRLNLDVRWNREAIDQAGIAVDQLVTVRVKDATLDDLLAAVLRGTGLAYRRDEQTIIIQPATDTSGEP